MWHVSSILRTQGANIPPDTESEVPAAHRQPPEAVAAVAKKRATDQFPDVAWWSSLLPSLNRWLLAGRYPRTDRPAKKLFSKRLPLRTERMDISTPAPARPGSFAPSRAGWSSATLDDYAKRALDVLLSGGGLLVSAPLWAAVAAAVKLHDGGPIFYCQDRVGHNARIFQVVKFRSMVVDAEAGVGAIQSGEHDPRITVVGRFLRATALDELPQLWNIFRGDMSFVGPRALRPGEIEVDSGGVMVALEDVPGFERRCIIKPGLTGVAQIFARRDLPRRHKFRYDAIYANNRSLGLDLKLIALSFWITFRGRWETRGKKF